MNESKPEVKIPQICDYCNKEYKTPPVHKSIYRNRRVEQRTFCSEQCASNAQMSAEG